MERRRLERRSARRRVGVTERRRLLTDLESAPARKMRAGADVVHAGLSGSDASNGWGVTGVGVASVGR